MTGEEAKARLNAMVKHYGIRNDQPLDTSRWAELAIAYDNVDPLSDEDAEDFARILVTVFSSLEQT